MIPVIQSYIETNRLLTADKPVIVGISGGCDSVALLSILNKLGYKCIATHCNFHLRGNESDRDESFCRQFTKQLKISFKKTDFDTRQYASDQHLSIEMAARELRYAWFEKLRKMHDAQAIAVAHHRDDSNETILLNLIRGTGIRGLCGIRPRNGMIVRPLLCVGKEDIIHFIEEQGLSFVTDSSNLSNEYLRNIIRMRLIPLMKEINPSIESALERTSEHLTDVESIYLQTIENVKKEFLKKTDNGVFCISIADIQALSAAKTILYELLQPFSFTRPQASAIFHTMQGVSGKIFDAPNRQYQLLKDRTSLLIYNKPEDITESYIIHQLDSDLSYLPIHLSMYKTVVDRSFEIDPSPLFAYLDYERFGFPLVLRKWKPGDWFIPLGMKGHKKLSDYFNDHKISLYQKDKIWLLCWGADIIWIVGERIDDRFCIKKRTKTVLVINFFEK